MRGFIDSLSLFKEAIFEKFKLEAIFFCLAAIFTLFSAFFFLKASGYKKIDNSSNLIIEDENSQSAIGKKISVHIAGAVVKPDVYEITSGARIKDVLILAGGLSQLADRDYFFRNYNLARVLSDQDKLYIPTIQDVISGYSQSKTETSNRNEIGNSSSAEIKININQATEPELDSLPGIGPSLSLKIINGRPYKSLEELVDRKILSKNLFEKIKSLLTF